jgi:hypothetical protein
METLTELGAEYDVVEIAGVGMAHSVVPLGLA